MSVIELDRVTSTGPGSSGDFTELLLPLYLGPTVKLQVGSSKEYEVHVDLLSKKSPYFAKMFQGGRFTEGITRKANLEPIDGVVSARSLEMLIEWIYREKTFLVSKTRAEKISEVLEFLRMANMCDVHGMEKASADFVQEILEGTFVIMRRDAIYPKHIRSTSLLPTSHPIRSVMAKAVASIYLNDDEDTFPFFDELSRSSSLSADIIKEMTIMVRGVDIEVRGPHGGRGHRNYTVTLNYQDPLADKWEGENITSEHYVPL